ncbi:hypothetical protein, partial [Actinoplanes siamensis]|uniref:hypothetical protein n=1 Tax=Actinoplanes siamensis TaxID=1223317 RepID=UPI001940EC38
MFSRIRLSHETVVDLLAKPRRERLSAGGVAPWRQADSPGMYAQRRAQRGDDPNAVNEGLAGEGRLGDV